ASVAGPEPSPEPPSGSAPAVAGPPVVSWLGGMPSHASAPLGPRPGVGSKGTQPYSPRYTSGQAWACTPRTRNNVGALGSCTPWVKPTATREGTPTDRAIAANAAANCSQ